MVMPNQNHNPRPRVNDEIELNGCHYFLSLQDGKWAIRQDGSWTYLDLYEGKFYYLGPVALMRGHSKWKIVPRKNNTKTTVAPPIKGLDVYEVTVALNKHVDVFKFTAKNPNHAKLLALGEMSRRLGMSIPLLRSKLLPDAFQVKLLPGS